MCVNITFIPDVITEDIEMFDVIASSASLSVSFIDNQTSVSIIDNNSKHINDVFVIIVEHLLVLLFSFTGIL